MRERAVSIKDEIHERVPRIRDTMEIKQAGGGMRRRSEKHGARRSAPDEESGWSGGNRSLRFLGGGSWSGTPTAWKSPRNRTIRWLFCNHGRKPGEGRGHELPRHRRHTGRPAGADNGVSCWLAAL